MQSNAALIAILLLSTPLPAFAREPPPPTPVARNLDPAQLARGGELFQQHCAQCHGRQAEGAPNWRTRLANGRFPPPPLNGSGHAWHHPASELKQVIIFGRNEMPSWNGKLGRQDVDDLVAWFQSRWPDEIYSAWARANQRVEAPLR